jgi:thiamine monophosphate synthase
MADLDNVSRILERENRHWRMILDANETDLAPDIIRKIETLIENNITLIQCRKKRTPEPGERADGKVKLFGVFSNELI